MLSITGGTLIEAWILLLNAALTAKDLVKEKVGHTSVIKHAAVTNSFLNTLGK